MAQFADGLSKRCFSSLILSLNKVKSNKAVSANLSFLYQYKSRSSLIYPQFAIFLGSQRVQDSLESGVVKLESAVENLNLRLARLLAEYSASQAKLKQRIAKLELR